MGDHYLGRRLTTLCLLLYVLRSLLVKLWIEIYHDQIAHADCSRSNVSLDKPIEQLDHDEFVTDATNAQPTIHGLAKDANLSAAPKHAPSK